MLGWSTAQGAASDFKTAEYLNQQGLDLVNAAEAYALGYTGAGVRVGILDSGIDAFHPEFRGGKIVGGYDFYSNTPYRSGLGQDYDGHGSHVAGIIGALRDGVGMHGVAFDSSLFIVHEDDRQYDYITNPDPAYLSPRDEWLDKSLAPAWRYLATQNLPIINNSLGFNACDPSDPGPGPCNVVDYGSSAAAEAAFPQSVAAFRELAAAGTLMVFATGNEEQPNPDFMAGAPYWFEDELKNNWLAVTAISETGEPVAYANKCGVAMDWCLTAPGGGEGNPGPGVNSVEDEGGYTRKSGTSMAAPHVAGAAALVKQVFPYFGAYHLQQTLLTTATDMGVSGVDAVYGWGLLNVGKAVRGPAQFTGLFDVDTLGYDSTFSNDIGGSGSLTKRGAGMLRLTGANTYSGPTEIEGGKLVVDGSLASNVTVQSAGALGGSGTVAKVDNHGVLAPGNSVGTLTVTGNYTAYDGSVYELEVGPDGATDKLVVGGTAALDGTLRLTGGRFRPDASYQFITAAGGFTGGFDTVAYGMAFLTPTLDLAAGAAALKIARNDVPIARYAATRNQKAVGQALDGASAHSPAGMMDVYDEVLNAEAGQVPAIMEQLSGQVHAGTESALLNAGGLVTRTLSNRMRANMGAGMAPGKALAQASAGAVPSSAMPYPRALPMWAQVVGGRSTLDGDGNAAKVRNDTTGLFLGGDTRLGGGWRLGGAFGYTEGRIKLDGPSSSSRANSYTGALYGSNSWAEGVGSVNFLGGMAYTRHHVDTRRHVTVGGSQTLKADYHADALQLFTELGYGVPVGESAMLEPYAGLSWQNLRAGSFTETGGQAALNGEGRRSDLTTFTLGLRGKTEFEYGRSQVSLSAGLGWRHAMGDVSPSRKLSFVHGDGAMFRTSGAPIARNAAVAELGAELRVARKTAVGLSYSGQFGNGNTDSAGTLYLRVRF
ncbi:autotransporter domain-containing protein [Pollutimonas sp. M17]|uniref:autotransporter domain-containing protein n=1 Tax=Pollutimonas sp. M17 TaxID=2962065 RepID=UPI0021F4A468|nr:autotransporter serine protease [Pollutimonas sp. M17]UYO95204.1 autotransporter domain-containing protein [Pollutimonas sp. M17]